MNVEAIYNPSYESKLLKMENMCKIKTLLSKVNIEINFLYKEIKSKGKGKAIPLQARCGPEGG